MKRKFKKHIGINDYQKAALRTERNVKYFQDSNGDVDTLRIVHGLMGLNGEAGECIDLYKKFMFHGHEFDKEHFAKELGDVAWYLAVCADAIGYDLETILKMNIEKLKKRYPDGFDSSRSIHRDSNDV